MKLFLLTFFSIYGAVHGYFFLKARRAFELSGWCTALLIIFLVLMVVTPVSVRLLENFDHEVGARLVAYPGYLWMGFLFLFLSVSLVLDVYGLGLSLSGFMAKRDLIHLAFTARSSFLFSFAVAAVVTIYGYSEALRIGTETITITTTKLPPGVERLRIVQVSDVHLGLIVRKERLQRMLTLVKEAEPDILVATGDLLDGQPDGYAESAAQFAEIRPRLGKYAVTGNHEFYVGIDKMEEFASAAGFILLRGESASGGGVITIAGVDDPAGRQLGRARNVAEAELLSALPREKFTLFLKHRPVVEPGSLGLFDLQLSGHVHKGQIFPFNILTHLSYPVRMGLSAAGKGSLLYVSRGTGTWGPPIRFLAPPEVTVIDLVRSR